MPPLPNERNRVPPVRYAAEIQASALVFTKFGTGTVRIRPALPARSGKTQRASRCSKLSTSRATSSARRSPQPMRSARIARSRFPLRDDGSGALSREPACSRVSQFPALTPSRLAPFTLVIPAASSGASRPLSAASDASFRIAAKRTLIEEAASPRLESTPAYSWTSALESGERTGKPRHQCRKSLRAFP